jgi:hypothetical protein
LPGRKEAGRIWCADVLLEVGKSLPADWQRPRTLHPHTNDRPCAKQPQKDRARWPPRHRARAGRQPRWTWLALRERSLAHPATQVRTNLSQVRPRRVPQAINQIVYRQLLPFRPYPGALGTSTVYFMGTISRSLGELAEVLGDRATAIELLREALPRNRAIGARPDTALTSLGLARLLRGRQPGRADRGRDAGPGRTGPGDPAGHARRGGGGRAARHAGRR